MQSYLMFTNSYVVYREKSMHWASNVKSNLGGIYHRSSSTLLIWTFPKSSKAIHITLSRNNKYDKTLSLCSETTQRLIISLNTLIVNFNNVSIKIFVLYPIGDIDTWVANGPKSLCLQHYRANCGSTIHTLCDMRGVDKFHHQM